MSASIAESGIGRPNIVSIDGSGIFSAAPKGFRYAAISISPTPDQRVLNVRHTPPPLFLQCDVPIYPTIFSEPIFFADGYTATDEIPMPVKWDQLFKAGSKQIDPKTGDFAFRNFARMGFPSSIKRVIESRPTDVGEDSHGPFMKFYQIHEGYDKELDYLHGIPQIGERGDETELLVTFHWNDIVGLWAQYVHGSQMKIREEVRKAKELLDNPGIDEQTAVKRKRLDEQLATIIEQVETYRASQISQAA